MTTRCPDMPATQDCRYVFDFDEDNDVDLVDVAEFQNAFAGG